MLTIKQPIGMISRIQRCPLIDGIGREVWTFVLGPSSGPRRMLVKPESDGRDGISAEICVFPEHCAVSRITTTVDNRTYLIYFDQERHAHNRAKATYIFLRLSDNGTACDFSMENDFPDIIRLSTM